MKKIFSTVAMAIVAFTAVVSMSSCQNDDPSSFNAAPQVPETTQTQNNLVKQESNTIDYVYNATISNDLLQLFDVTITRTVGSESKTYTFSNSCAVADAMSTGLDCFQANKAVNVTIKADFKVKATAMDFLAKVQAEKGEDASINTTAAPTYTIPVMDSSETNILSLVVASSAKAKTFTADKLDKMAAAYAEAFSVSNK